MIILRVLAIEPIELVTDEVAGPASQSPGLSTIILIAIAMVVAAALLAFAARALAPKLTLTRDPCERGFRLLARKLRLKRSHRATLRQFAKHMGLPPVALTLCHSAFSAAVGAADSSAPADLAHFLELEHRLFG